MVKLAKNIQVFALIFILSALAVVAIAPSIASVKAQSQATIDVLVSAGGSTVPDAGTTTYADGTVVTLTATPGPNFVFSSWEIVSSAGGVEDLNNPTTLTVTGGVTYAVQAVFNPIQLAPGQVNPINTATAAIVVVLPGVGGTTSPVAGTYALANATQLNLAATPVSGFRFDHWVIGGSPMNHGAYAFTDTPTNNPYTVDHGYGNTYSYQPVFVPTSTSPTPTVPEYSSVAAIIVALALVSVAVGTFAYKRKSK